MNVVRYFWKGTKTERGAMVVPPLSERRDRGVKSLLTCHVCNLERSKKEKQKKELLIAAVLTTHFVSSWLWCLNFTTCVRLIGDTGDVCVCRHDSPPGSTAARPLWFLRSSWFRTGRVPSGRSECWRACWAFRRTSPPVARPRQTPCLHWLPAPAERRREREKWGLTPSVITAPIKAGQHCGWQTSDTVCPLAFFS